MTALARRCHASQPVIYPGSKVAKACSRNTSDECIYPPIPVRAFDWVAWYDGEEESGHYGYGPSHDEALKDLIESYPLDETCLGT